MRFTGCKREPDRQAVGIYYRMNLAGQTAAWSAHGLSFVPSDPDGMLMHAHNRRIDHLHGCVMRGGRINPTSSGECDLAHVRIVKSAQPSAMVARCLEAACRW